MNKKKTPLTSHRVRETVEELLELLSKRQNEVAALRSELSAAQEEIIRLNSKINYQDAVIQQRNAMLTAESGEQTK